MSQPQEPGRSRLVTTSSREQAKRDADQRQQGATAYVGQRLMNRWNRDLRDPSLMATSGHDTTFGYEFVIQEDGFTFTVEVRRDMDD